MKNYFFLLSALFLAVIGESDAQSIIRGPYLQLGTSSSMVIKWRTDIPTSSRVWYGSSPTSLAFTETINGSYTDHEVTISGLPANTTFYYAVGNTSGQLMAPSNGHYFRTSPTPGTTGTTTIWVLGDAGEPTDDQRAVRDAFYSFNGGPHADVILALGDNAYNDGTDDEYQEAWFQNMFEASLANSVVWPCPGNHDIRSASSITETGVYYDIFTLPRNGEAGGVPSGTEAYYSFNYGDIHFISLNSEDIDQSLSSPMLAWLQQDLEANTLPWIVAFLHRGLYHSSAAADFRHNFLPVLEAGGVDLVLGGHNHSYRRSYLIDGHYGDGNGSFDLNTMALDTGNGRTDGDGAYQKPSGTTPHAGAVYMVTGSAGSVNPLPSPVVFMPYGAGEPEGLGSVHIAVSGGMMDLTFINYENQVLDYFTIQKQVFTGNPPVVSVTGPVNGANFTAPREITITAAASDSDGSITQVEFFVNNQSVGTDNQAPYSIAYTIPANGTYSVAAYATDNDGNTSTSAEVQFTVGPITTCSRIAQSSDDGEEQAGNIGLTSSDLELVTDGTDVQTVGMRFTGLNIPQGATITNAYIQFTVDEAVNDNPCSLTIYGEASDDAATFNGQDFNISGRPRVASSVSWAPSDWLSVGDAGYAQQTPDIASIIQDIVNRPGFSAGSSLALFIEGTGRRTAESFDGTAASAPELCVEFSAEPIVYDCPLLSANNGDSCDDGDNTTINDMVVDCTCAGTPTPCAEFGDDDGDGVCANVDCDDHDASINSSILNDADCDGAPSAEDCDDNDPDINPSAQEICDGIDNDCDGLVDGDDPSVIGQDTWYADTDGDGFGDPNNTIQSCSQPTGFVADNTDCNDTNASLGSNANDMDCDGVPAGMDCDDNDADVISTNIGDADCDGVPTAQDCDDNDQSVGSNANDMDCDGVPSDVDCDDNNYNITHRPGDPCEDGDPSTFGETYQPDCSCGGGTLAPTTVCSFIDSDNDDAEERMSNGRVDLTSSDLELCTDRNNSQYVGLRFNNLDIPKGATITSAHIQFTVDESRNDDPCGLVIYGQAADNAATFSGDNFSISSLPRTSNSVAWAPSQWQSVGDAGPDQQTPDISAIVQEVVNRNNYTSSSSMAFIIEGGGSRVAESFDGNSTPPELCVSFLATPPDYDCPELSAFIGDSCDDGDNTTIDDRVNSACICEGTETECTGPGDEDGDGVCTGQDCDDSDPYVTTQLGDACDDGNPATINDMIGPGCVCAGTLNDCPIAGDEDGDGICSDVDCNDDDASITQQIGDACDDGNPNTIGETIQADCSCGGGPSMPVQACSTVSNGDDDAEERLNSGRVNLNSSDLELITDPRHGAQAVGLRFSGLNIPQGAVITSAYIQFTVDEAVNDNPCDLSIYGQALDDAPPFTSSDFDISSRPRTNAVVNWRPPDWNSVGDAGPAQQTPGLSAIIQEIVNQSNYSAASSIGFVIEGAGRRTAESANGPPTGLPELCVEYIGPSTGARPFSSTPPAPGGMDRENGDAIPTVKPGNSGLPGSLIVYPNPAEERLTVAFNSSLAGPVQVQARDINGRVVIRDRWEAQIGRNAFSLDELSLPDGVYFLQLHSADALATVKFVIQHH